VVFRGIRTKRLERSEDNEDRRPAVVKREWEMDEKLIKVIRRGVGLLDDVVDVLRGLSGATSCDTQFKHTVTAELTQNARMNATLHVLGGHKRLSRGPYESYQLHSVS